MQSPSSCWEFSKRWKRKKQKERNTLLGSIWQKESRLHDSKERAFCYACYGSHNFISTLLHTKGNEEELAIHRETTSFVRRSCLHDIILKQPSDRVSTGSFTFKSSWEKDSEYGVLGYKSIKNKAKTNACWLQIKDAIEL